MMRDLLDQLEATLAEHGQGVNSKEILLAFFNTLPLPAWVKAVRSDGGIAMVRVNQAYVKAYGLTTADVQQREATGALEEIALWNVNDKRALEDGRTITAVEQVTMVGDDQPKTCLVYKWPVRTANGQAVFGMSVPIGGAFNG